MASKVTAASIIPVTCFVAGITFAQSVFAQQAVVLSDRVDAIQLGLFCAPQDGMRRDAPDTLAGWIHVTDSPVDLVAEGQIAPAVLGLGFGVRYRLRDDAQTTIRFTVTHPPIPPSNLTDQSWDGVVEPGAADTVFFQFDITEELQPGDWSFTAIDHAGEQLFYVEFAVLPASDLPELADLCLGGNLYSAIQATPDATG